MKKKRVLGIMLSFALVIGMMPVLGMSMPAYAITSHTHDSTSFNYAWTISDSLPVAAGDYYLETDVEISATWTVPDGVTNLCLNGHSISFSGTAKSTVIEVGMHNTLNLYDCKASGTITGGSCGVRINTYGTLNMHGGTITSNTAESDGGGVLVGSEGTFNMYGGEISGNAAAQYGGGVNNNGTFTMSGGEISGNTAGYDGGGVCNGTYGIFNMSGGEISGNTATQYGGGVEIIGTFNLSGKPIITGNTAKGVANNVFLYGSNIITITGNLASGASVGVNLSKHTGIFTSGLSEKLPVGKSVDEIFFSDNEDYAVLMTDAGEARLVAKGESHIHDGIVFKEWTDTMASIQHDGDYDEPDEGWRASNCLPKEPGNYYLKKDVVLSDSWVVPQGGINLCLNGKTITKNGDGNYIFAVGKQPQIPVTTSLCVFDESENDGKINPSNYKGGVIIQNNASFTMNGGRIIGDSTSLCGVRVYGGSFIMNDGIITGNTKGDESGVLVDGSNSTFRMNGGIITGNTIGVIVASGQKLHLSGDSEIRDGIEIQLGYQDNTIIIDGPLSNTTPIPILLTYGESSEGVFTNGWSTHMGEADPADYFIGKNIDQAVVLNSNEAHLVSSIAKPAFSPAPGTYAEAQKVSINCNTDGAVIYYTTDGSNPKDPSSTKKTYTGPISVSSTTTIKAYAAKGDETPSDVVTATYTISTTPTPSPGGGGSETDAVQKVIDMIDALPVPKNVTVNDEAVIKAARDEYSKLTTEQKADTRLTDPLNKLTECESALEAAKESAEDQKAADGVCVLFKALPSSPSKADETQAREAIAAYDKLTDAQKSLIGEEMNYKVEEYKYFFGTKDAKVRKVTMKSVKAKKGRKATATWRKNPKVSGYQLVYSTSKKFTRKTTKKATIKSYKTVSKTVKNLKAGKKYFFKIRPYTNVENPVTDKTEKVYGKWSKVKSCKAKK